MARPTIEEATARSPVEFEKLCPACRRVKPITEFSRNRSKANGRAAYCRPCHAQRLREYYATDHGAEAHRISTRRSVALARARHEAAVADLSPQDRARLGLAD